MAMEIPCEEDILLSVINNGFTINFGKYPTSANHVAYTITLPKAYTHTNFVTMANATIHSHWAIIQSFTVSSITIKVDDYGNNTSTGFQWSTFG